MKYNDEESRRDVALHDVDVELPKEKKGELKDVHKFYKKMKKDYSHYPNKDRDMAKEVDTINKDHDADVRINMSFVKATRTKAKKLQKYRSKF